MNNGRLMRWLKQPGDAVANGDALAEVETDKAVMEVEAFHDGYLAGPLAAINAELPVGQTIGFIADTMGEAKSGTIVASSCGISGIAARSSSSSSGKDGAGSCHCFGFGTGCRGRQGIRKPISPGAGARSPCRSGNVRTRTRRGGRYQPADRP